MVVEAGAWSVAVVVVVAVWLLRALLCLAVAETVRRYSLRLAL